VFFRFLKSPLYKFQDYFTTFDYLTSVTETLVFYFPSKKKTSVSEALVAIFPILSFLYAFSVLTHAPNAPRIKEDKRLYGILSLFLGSNATQMIHQRDTLDEQCVVDSQR
jgi:hypothetical protein